MSPAARYVALCDTVITRYHEWADLGSWGGSIVLRRADSQRRTELPEHPATHQRHAIDDVLADRLHQPGFIAVADGLARGSMLIDQLRAAIAFIDQTHVGRELQPQGFDQIDEHATVGGAVDQEMKLVVAGHVAGKVLGLERLADDFILEPDALEE